MHKTRTLYTREEKKIKEKKKKETAYVMSYYNIFQRKFFEVIEI